MLFLRNRALIVRLLRWFAVGLLVLAGCAVFLPFVLLVAFGSGEDTWSVATVFIGPLGLFVLLALGGAVLVSALAMGIEDLGVIRDRLR